MFLLKDTTHGDAGEARTRAPRSRVKQSTTEPLRSLWRRGFEDAFSAGSENVKKKGKKGDLYHFR